jgi:fatty acid-binding protein DegV
LGIEKTLRIVGEQIPRTKTFALLSDLNYAVRGGRLPQWVRTLATLLHITPIVCIKPDGRIGLGGWLFGRRKRISKFARLIAANFVDHESIEIGIGHAICPEDADRLATELRGLILRLKGLKICDLGTGLGVHGGPGTLIVSGQPALSPDDLTVDID